jgi:methionyl-tRNA synthetase
MTRHFVSAGWPYLYDIPGLHNCVPMLFADVYARYYRLKGDEVYFLCGADEHGARTEYVAQGYGITPKQLLDEKYQATLPLLEKMGLSFDNFGRTGDPFHKQFVQEFFTNLIARNMLVEGKQKVAWCTRCEHHLPDRFLEGTCPYCNGKTYGNQCNNKKNCSRLVEADQIQNAQCAVCAGEVEWRDETHLFFQMEQFKNALLNCAQAPEKDKAEVQKRILATLAENPNVCVTRDTAWGISVPQLPGKSVYSWVDSLLAKVSMLVKIGNEQESNYWKEADTQHHFFLGMDGTPFYGTLFPALLMAAQKNYNLDHWTLMPNEVFIYEGGICSKSTGTGIWLQEALATLPADFWRFYIFFIHASVESGSERDVDFRWDRFCESVNTWLIKGLSAAATNEKHVSGSDGTVEERLINGYMESGNIGQAFQLLLKTLVENPCQEKTRRLAPLLNCFLPTTGDLLSMGVKPFAIAPLYYREIQMDYQDKVDARRAQRGLAEELTDARADALCVCPINLTEQ